MRWTTASDVPRQVPRYGSRVRGDDAERGAIALRKQSQPRSKIAVQSPREDRDRTAVGVVGGVVDELVVGGEGQVFIDGVGIVGLDDGLAAIVQRAVADQ